VLKLGNVFESVVLFQFDKKIFANMLSNIKISLEVPKQSPIFAAVILKTIFLP